ncbi:S1 family peptidase [Xanthobacter sp. DSM 24535]|uniref:S1 family peptidase n=1 Tax=Roseixanthobacter psychrophilus TaxID=3119917 RepID=UPI00372C6C3F
MISPAADAPAPRPALRPFPRPPGRALRFAGLLLAGLTGLAVGPARAIVGGEAAAPDIAAHVVLIVSTRGASCTGSVVARDLVLTAAHCVHPAGDYAVALVSESQPRLVPALRIVVHPAFNAEQFRTRRPTPDLALMKLAEPLPARFTPVRIATGGLPARGSFFLLAGFGVSAEGTEKTAGKLRTVLLASIGTTGGIMARLSPQSGLAGGCVGDSGGPAFQNGEVAGVIGWATGPNGARGCGGVTGVTLVGLHRDWILSTARALGSPVGD